MARDELSPRRDTTDIAGVRLFGVRGSREVLVPTSALTGGGGGEVTVRDAGVFVGTRPAINFIEGSNVTLTFADDPGNGEVDVTIAASGGGGAVARGINAELKSESSLVLIVGTEATIILPYSLTLDVTDSWRISSDDVCSCIVDVQRATVAAPNTFASIAASAKPTLSTDDYNTGAMTGWSTSLLAGERIRLVVESVSGTNAVQVVIPAES